MRRCIFLLLMHCVSIVSVVQGQEKKITLDDIYAKGIFRAKGVYGLNSMADGEHYSMLDANGDLVKCAYATGNKVADLITAKELMANKIDGIDDYSFSADETKILFASASEKIYRYSFSADYYIYDLSSKKITKLSDAGKQRLASFSPNADKVAFVRENNIFIKDLGHNTEQAITTDGRWKNIINGAPDWVYEEEFGFTQAYEWSPDGDKIAYYRFDESRVKEYPLQYFSGLYTSIYDYKYPKAGEENSVVEIKVYNLASGKTVNMGIGVDTQQYIPRIKWSKKNDKLCIMRLNRLQNKLDVLMADADNGKSEVILSEENKYYISEVNDKTILFTDSRHFIYTSERDGYNHFYYYKTNGKLVRQITQGPWDDIEVLAYDPNEDCIYYTSHEESSLQQTVYAIKTDGSGKIKISTKTGTNDAVFSKNFKYSINTHSSLNSPPWVALYDSSRRLVRVLEDNEALRQRMDDYCFPQATFTSIPVNDSISLNAYIIKPADFDSTRKYPVLMYVYGGPQSQTANDSWTSYMAWFTLLTQKGYIVACVDNRGTDGRGEAFRKCTYMQLGKLEVRDQIEAARFFAAKPWVDAARIGIFGWSYGGYMAALCMTKGADFFKMGIAVAPVTNWRFYDSVYTERFMRTPQENARGYDDNSPINFVDLLKGPLLIVHGTGDDNVHLQNSVEFIEKLVKANKQFEMQFYPNKDHSIRGGNASLHLFTRMTNFIEKNL